jgi:MFS superfamily sulfate permease-like transporter
VTLARSARRYEALALYRASRPHVAVLGRDPGDAERWSDLQRHPDNERKPGIVVVRCESALFFANADAVRDAIHANLEHDTFAVVLDCETVPAIDVTAVTMLTALADDLRRDGVELAFARDVGDVRELVRLGVTDAPLPRYPTVKSAVDALRRKAIA